MCINTKQYHICFFQTLVNMDTERIHTNISPMEFLLYISTFYISFYRKKSNYHFCSQKKSIKKKQQNYTFPIQ